MAEAGIQILTVGVIGGALAAAWQAIARRREEAAAAKEKQDATQNERRDRIRAELAQLVGLYNDVKEVRRTLRSLGLDLNLHVPDEDLRKKQREKKQARKEALESLRRRRREERMLEQRHERESALARDRAGRLARAIQTVTGTRKRHRGEEARRKQEEVERRRSEEAKRRKWAELERQWQEGQRRRRDERKRTKAAEAERTRARRRALETAEQLTEHQVDGFQKQMRRLNRLQLDYEAKVREYRQIELLGKDTIKVVDDLELVESYLNALVALWEERSWMIQEGTPLREVSDLLQELYRRDDFRTGFSRRMNEITKVMNRHLFDFPESA